MLTRVKIGLICFFLVLSLSCTPRITQLPVATPQSTPVPATATATSVTSPTPAPSATVTLLPTAIPTGAIHSDNLKQVKLLHQYWLAAALAADVDPYEMDVSAIASSPDGRLIAVGGCSKPLEADLRSGNVFCNGNDASSPEGVPFLLILDANTESVIKTVPENQPDTTITDLAFTPDGNKLVYALYPGKVAVWDVPTSEMEAVIWEGKSVAPRLAISPDGRWIALKTTDQVQIWDATIGKIVTQIPGYFRPQFSVDSQRILVYHDRKFVVHETDTWTELWRFGMPCDCVYAISPDLSLLATAERIPSEDNLIVVWDTATGEQVQAVEAGRGFTAFLSFIPDGTMLWRAGEHGDLTAWDTREWKILAGNIGGITPIFNLHGFQFTGDGRHYLLLSDLLIGLYGLP